MYTTSKYIHRLTFLYDKLMDKELSRYTNWLVHILTKNACLPKYKDYVRLRLMHGSLGKKHALGLFVPKMPFPTILGQFCTCQNCVPCTFVSNKKYYVKYVYMYYIAELRPKCVKKYQSVNRLTNYLNTASFRPLWPQAFNKVQKFVASS